MKGQEIINHIIQAKMPDREQIRENCHQQGINRPSKKKNAWILCTASVAVCISIVVAISVFGKFRVNNHNGDYAVYIPVIDLSEQTDYTLMMNMIGLFVYQGRIYTVTDQYYKEGSKAIENLIGERLGHAKGNINEWSKQDEYAVEFAGTAKGDVYAVNGYDPQFRLCLKVDYTDDNGEFVGYAIQFFENLNNIGLTFGSDLFEDRLRLRGRWDNVKYQVYDSEGNNDVYHTLEGVSNEDISAFIDKLYSGKFKYANNAYSSGLKRVSLNFQMNDNTKVTIELVEGGYVGDPSSYHIKIPGDVFNKIFNACK